MKILVLGSGGHAWPIVDAVKQSDFQLQGIIDIEYSGQNEKILGYPIIGDFSVLSNFNSDEVAIIIAIGDRKKRSKYYKKVREYGFKTPSIFHPKAIISDYRKIDDGVFINSGAIINAGVEIGENSIINTGAIIEHEVKIGRN